MTQAVRPPSLAEVERRVCDIAAEQVGLPRTGVFPHSRVVHDLHCDSLDFVELIMKVEEAFDCAFERDDDDPLIKSVFTRDPFRLCDLAEMAYLRQGTGRRPRKRSSFWGDHDDDSATPRRVPLPFTQLGGRLAPEAFFAEPLHEPLGANAAGFALFRRRTDGMLCVRIPAGTAILGSEEVGFPDERPPHRAALAAFLIDVEPVSTEAYCRFLNSIRPTDDEALRDWIGLDSDDHRREFLPVRFVGDAWVPLPGTERLPMILVSWCGANAYSLWANRRGWRNYRGDAGSFLPTEAQWEYAARGPEGRRFPWGDAPPTGADMRFGVHVRGQTYAPNTLPMAAVNEQLAVSPFGLRHMAGNVWQWCRDWYDSAFYRTPAAVADDPCNGSPTAVRSERGGSWVGPAHLCRSAYRRGRAPAARGRCLGFRCVGDATRLAN